MGKSIEDSFSSMEERNSERVSPKKIFQTFVKQRKAIEPINAKPEIQAMQRYSKPRSLTKKLLKFRR
jgi:hypothetical protein